MVGPKIDLRKMWSWPDKHFSARFVRELFSINQLPPSFRNPGSATVHHQQITSLVATNIFTMMPLGTLFWTLGPA